MADEKTKNAVFLSHASAGKTSLAEAILYKTGASSRLGSVDEGTSISDYHPDEKERKISINSSILTTNYKNNRINILDSPGYADFLGEAVANIQIADSSILVICGVQGIEVGTERMWRIIEERNLPCIIFINKLDKENSDFFKTLEAIKEAFGQKCLAFQLPRGRENSFEGSVDLIAKENIKDLSDEDKEKASLLRLNIIESAIETDDLLTEKYLEGKELTHEEIRFALKKAVQSRKIVPVLCGSALKDKSVDYLLNVIADYLPFSDEMPHVEAKKPGSEETIKIDRKKDGPFSALVFKTVSDPYVGQLTIFRVYSGVLSSDTSFYNAPKGESEKIGKLYYLLGKEQKTTDRVIEGDIAAVAKLKSTETSDTLCDEKTPVIFDPIKFPEPVISFSITPKSRSDEEKISEALHKLTIEDQTFKVSRDPQTKELIISGMGDLHVDIMVKRLKANYGVEVTVSTPKVAYKETITTKTKAQGKYKKQSGGRGQYGDAWIEIEPLPRGGGFEFVDKIVGGAIPRNYIPAVEKGVKQAMLEGVITGNPLVDIRVALYDGSYHSVDSSDLAFQIAGAMALRKAVQEANSILLEPIMEVEVFVPSDFTGQISGDLSSRRGRILGMEPKGQFEVVKASVPLAEMFKYATELRSMTQGKGSYTMKFASCEPVPQKITERIIEKSKKEKQEQAK
jgi:elongation factor G